MAKKTPESKEDAAARRQRELAALTSGVAAFSLMGAPAQPEQPQPAAPTQVAQPAAPTPVASKPVNSKPANSKPVASKAVVQPPQPAVTSAPVAVAAASPAGGAGQEPEEEPETAIKPSAAAAGGEPEDELDELDELDESQQQQQQQQSSEAEASLPAEGAELDLAQLFVPSAEKKGTTLRITADHQQFFTQIGFLLGAGASAPDIVHNILTRFRADHEAQIQKALKKKMRLMLSSKK
ncbi:hypothetical protein [Hymenobacter actinosclerus]|uniref:Uncharacterized protein n=1 Tax=Hymenobacter actinosclerus TaxID=82805 RepID=A0A1I0IJW7_9BACT|nr:hypothetical protein [Hymenobacter actinosclerus]SET97339.1 hypothetical protein SAMN04487998_3347 [Hymenobacter actinosclerus]